jgi:type I restriction enzyme S subunit
VFGAEIQPDWLPLGELVQDIENGWSPACHSRPALAEEWGVIRLGAVSFGTFDANENKALPGHLVPRPKYEIRSGDLLISRANTQELVGASALVKEVRPRLMLCDKVFRVVFRPASAIDAVYLDRTLKSPAIRRQVEAAATGTSPTMKNISKAKLMALRLPVPPIDVQQRLVTRLRAFEERIGKTRELSNRTHLELGALQAATVDRALTA